MSLNFFAVKKLFFVSVLLCSASATDSNEDTVPLLNADNFRREVDTGAADKVIVFCKTGHESCQHMVESLRKLEVIWRGMGQFPGTEFAEVSCTKDQALCDEEHIHSFPSAIHYRKGIRLSSWTAATGNTDQTPVWQFVSWVRSDLEARVPVETGTPEISDAVKGTAVSPLGLVSDLFADMDFETAAVGWCLVVACLGIVAWVVMEGFELWPEAKQEPAAFVPGF